MSNFLTTAIPSNIWSITTVGDGVKVVSTSSTGGADVDDNSFRTTINSPVTRINIRSYKNTATPSTTANVTVGVTRLSYCTNVTALDSDSDNIPNYLDLDSDNDGCLDAIEGGADFKTANLVNAGGTLSVGTGSLTTSNQNLCGGSSCVGSTVTTIGVPTVAVTGQATGSSQNAAVNACLINAVDDNFTGTALSIGDSSALSVVGNNDVLQGATPVIGTATGTVTLTEVGTQTALTLNTNGTIKVNANTPSGTYSLNYKICENGANPTNCDNATATVLVKNVIDAVVDDFTGTPVTIGDSTASVVGNNDKLDGVTPVIGTNPGQITLTEVSVPTELKLNTDGTITVQPNAPSGTYTLEYKICENGANPTNCDNTTATVLVKNVIDAVVDDFTGTAVTIGDSTPSVVGNNDTLDEVTPVIGTNPGQITLTEVSVPTALKLNTDGTITVQPNTPSGTYTLEYKICENGANPTNCDNATATVLVKNVIDAVVDVIPEVINGLTGGTTPSVLLNDKLDDVLSPVNVTLISVPVGPLSISSDGIVSVAPNTPAGVYSIPYTICENGANPVNCSSTTATVEVKSGLVSNPDINGGIVSLPIQGNVNTNDITPIGVTYGTPIASSVNPTTKVPTLQPNGSYVFEVDTPGIYVFDVPVCLLGQLAPCPTEPLVISVLDQTIINPPVANPNTAITKEDVSVLIPVQSGNWPGNLGGVLGNPANITNIEVGSTATVTANGQILYTPAPGFVGVDVFMYEVCETPSGLCTTTTVEVTVLDSAVANVTVAADQYVSTVQNTSVNGSINVTGIDPEGNAITVTPQNLAIAGKGTIVLLANGSFTFTPLPEFVGTVAIPYESCDNGLPVACAKATLYVVVRPLTAPKISLIKVAKFNDDKYNDGFAQAGETISYSFEIKNTGDVPLYNIVLSDVLPGVTVNGSSIAVLNVGDTDAVTYTATYTLTQSDIIKGNVENQASVIGVTALGTTVSDFSSATSLSDDEPTVLGIQGCVVDPLSAVSPNGDGDNDVFYVRGIECYSDNSVLIYNRWGVLVFEREGYNNSDKAFRGISEGRVNVLTNELPEGTYYYVIRYVDSESNGHQKAGYLYLNR